MNSTLLNCKYKQKLSLVILSLLLTFNSGKVMGQSLQIEARLSKQFWSAYWITAPDVSQRDYGVYHFRKAVSLSSIPKSFIIHISADNRYRLFVNGTPVCSGPAYGDLFNWYYETIDIAPYLKEGSNTLAAMVWNMGTYSAVGQISNQTAFVVQGNTETEDVVNTNSSWKVIQNTAYTPFSTDNQEKLQAYLAIGPGDRVEGSKYPWGWQTQGYRDDNWKNASEIVHPEPTGYGTDNRWTLVPRPIPLFKEQDKVRFSTLRRARGITVNEDFVSGQMKLRVPSHQKVSLLFDQGENIAAYPELIVSAGKGSTIKQTYAESLFDSKGMKGNRNEIDGKEIKGNEDLFLPDGGNQRTFRPMWFRAYRYLQLDIETGDEDLVLNDLYSTRTGYPFSLKATFSSNDASLKDIWEVSWRTARLCAGEAYYDTPYYEQLQYTGDSRIQALISLYCAGDDRLVKKSILDFYRSRTPEGLTQGRYPSNRLQIIPTFSLFWVSMVHDYWMHRQDDQFVKQFLPAIHEIMEWFHNRVDKEKHMLGPLSWWNFVDWTSFNGWGTAPGAETGGSSILTLQYAYTLKQAAELFSSFGQPAIAQEQMDLAHELIGNTYSRCYNQEKGLLADTPEQLSYSQHAGIWGVLTDAIPTPLVKPTMQSLLRDTSIAQVTYYYRFYLVQALKKVGMGDLYGTELKPWREMLKLGLTTFSEKPEPTRSDCHAWSASPNYDFLATICGIMPETPGFKKILIKPCLGELKEVAGKMPHPNGTISVKFKRMGISGVLAEFLLPANASGTFVWNGKSYPLNSGKQKLVIKS
ncbi:alpha-L-rhamnosidase-related protein [Pedobacter sp. AW31-3R]|uniref:alpha-L-rhamnosidase-related protein n=1 Tax=Pedobacter sp. AW31-3R TaxID=3445781 RepID=UPI003F9FA221